MGLGILNPCKRMGASCCQKLLECIQTFYSNAIRVHCMHALANGKDPDIDRKEWHSFDFVGFV